MLRSLKVRLIPGQADVRQRFLREALGLAEGLILFHMM